MKLLKRVHRLIDHLGLQPHDERPLDVHLTQEDIAAELHYPRPVEAQEPGSVRVTMLEHV
ncbi:MAG TPA: hypothetical protein V6D05_01130 [Stenomitos sp.]